MTKDALEILLERISGWPEEAQNDFARSVAEIESRYVGIYRLNESERAAVRSGLQEMRAATLASPDEVAAVFARYRA